MPWLSQNYLPLPHEDLLSWVFDHTTYDLDKPVRSMAIYIDAENTSRTLSCRQGKSIVRKLIAGFRKAGLKKGDCVCITSFNDIMYSMGFLGIIGAGGIFSGFNPAYKPFEVRHHIRTADVSMFIVEPELLANVVDTATAEGIPKDKIFVFNTRGQKVPEGFRSWEWLLQHGEEDWIRFNDLETCKGTTVARLTTSGTTGPPKMAMQSVYNATSFHTMMYDVHPVPWEPRYLYPLPQFHVSTVPGVHASPFRSGHVAYIMRRFELEAYLAAIKRFQINYLGMVPPLVMAIINSPLRHKYSLKSIRRVGCGAAPLDKGSQLQFKALCAPGCTFTQVWGMTETTSALSMFYYPEDDDTGSVGSQFMANTDVMLLDENGNDITDFDVRGELCVRGPTVINGYYNNPKANAESFIGDGWFKTGDILYCDGKSKLWYIELIKVRGFQVAPPELEEVILAHPDVADCAVIGIKMSKLSQDESPRAYVVRQPGAKITAEDIKKVISDTLASYKALTGGVVFIDEIPKSPSGKMLKRVLREQAEIELQTLAKL
ncbi:acetyl-CoA synthetase-like protein [Rhizodiscina lignyota]|uniref:Acetyl-CoA synthetase-like protein n=1 Tax=Rhizodiscina lignyota TaxID=1504668 RepID=A0A9P4IQM5_9PEZI|nr:acetyl-CoA synthetase-like protein [Rhizodiscina lignyota]